MINLTKNVSVLT